VTVEIVDEATLELALELIDESYELVSKNKRRAKP